MNYLKALSLAVFVLCFSKAFAFQQSNPNNTQGLDEAFEKYWLANSKEERQKFIKKIASGEYRFEDVYKQLEQGKKYSSNVPRGFIEWTMQTNDGLEHYVLLFIPYNYDPLKKYEVNFFMHGAVGNLNSKFVNTVISRENEAYKTREYISVYPSSWVMAKWWHNNQYENINMVLDKLKTIYNVDENRIKLGGVSDGATGTYVYANYNATPWSCFTPYIGTLEGAGNVSKKQTYACNFKNRPFFIVNTGKDHIFPPKFTLPYIDLLKKAEVDVQFHFIDTAGHSMRWYPLLEASVKDFIANNPRNPLPDALYWETEFVDKYNRNHWLIIDKIGKVKGESDLKDINSIEINSENFPAFIKRDLPSGRVDLYKEKNTIYVKTKGVRKYTLLLSPAQFDFEGPIKIYTNNILSFEGIVTKNVNTLLKYALIDNDRTMLFGAEVTVKVGKSYK